MKFVKKLICFIFVMIIAAIGLVTYGGYQKYKQALMDKPLNEVILEMKSRDSYAEYSEIAEFYFDAVVAVEDRRFYDHSGFDFIGTARAVVNDIKARRFNEGGSTISQQLAKNLYFPADNSPERKVAEIFMAVKIEKEYSKQQVLELYANAIYFGSGYYCIKDAAQGYFGKTPDLLDEYEASMLAGIPNAPSVYSPAVNPALAAERQRQVLVAMADCDYIEKTKIEEIMSKK